MEKENIFVGTEFCKILEKKSLTLQTELSKILDQKLSDHIKKLRPVIESISENNYEKAKLLNGLPLHSLESFYLSKALLSIKLHENYNLYSVRRNQKIMASIKKHEASYFRRKEKPNLIVLIENWCHNKDYGSFSKGIESFQVACVLCENIIHWKKKSISNINDSAKNTNEGVSEMNNFSIGFLESYLYDWLSCIANAASLANENSKFKDLEDFDTASKALIFARLRLFSSPEEKKAEIINVTHFYLSLFVKLGFLKKDTNSYTLGDFLWTIHQNSLVVPFFPLDSKFRKVIYNKDKDAAVLFSRFIEFSPLKWKTALFSPKLPIPLISLPLWYNNVEDYLCEWADEQLIVDSLSIDPVYFVHSNTSFTTSTNKVKEFSRAVEGHTLRFNLAMLEAGQTFYVSDFYLQECLDLEALYFYDNKFNSSNKHLINRCSFITYYASQKKYDVTLLTPLLMPEKPVKNCRLVNKI